MKKQVHKKIILFSCLLAITQVNAQTWTQKADFGGPGRYFASGFSVGNKGYIGLGTDSELNDKKDFWEYNPESDTWTQKADFPAPFTERSVGFAIANKGYIATDQSGNFWEYNSWTNTWTQKADYPGAIVGATSFSIGNKGYIVTGEYSHLLWEWDGDTASVTYNTWTQKALFPPTAGRYGATGFSIGTKGYIGTGTDGSAYKQDLWEWDGDTASETYNAWTQKASLPGVARIYAVSFSVGSCGYIGTGLDFNKDGNLIDFWKWDQATDIWTQMPDFTGPARQAAVAFNIGDLGYIGTGGGYPPDVNLKDFWEFCDTCFEGTHENLATPNISIYPNPASEILYVRNPELKNESLAEIYNICGSLIFDKTIIGDTEMDISGMETGFYTLTIKNNNNFYSTKLIIER
jgi:N-acetylneuraminic acid mutarotase